MSSRAQYVVPRQTPKEIKKITKNSSYRNVKLKRNALSPFRGLLTTVLVTRTEVHIDVDQFNLLLIFLIYDGAFAELLKMHDDKVLPLDQMIFRAAQSEMTKNYRRNT